MSTSNQYTLTKLHVKAMDIEQSDSRKSTQLTEALSPSKTRYQSFQSPTRASLSRFNPKLLPDSRSSPGRRNSPSNKQKRRAESHDPLQYALDPKRRKTAPPSQELGSMAAPVESDTPKIGEEEQGETELAEESHIETPHGPRHARKNQSDKQQVEEEDLPETPQHLRQNPEFKDTPPRGILFHSTPRRRSARVSKNASRRSTRSSLSITENNAEDTTEVQLQPTLPSSEDVMLLRQKKKELNELQETLRELEGEIEEYERHSDLLEKWQPSAVYDDIDGLM